MHIWNLMLHQNKNSLQYLVTIVKHCITSLTFTISFFLKNFMFWDFLNLRHRNCGFIGPIGGFFVQKICNVVILAIQKELLKIWWLWCIFFTNVLCMNQSDFLICFAKKLPTIKMDYWNPFLLMFKRIVPHFGCYTWVSITIFDSIRWIDEYLYLMELLGRWHGIYAPGQKTIIW